ncbi:30S ribosomal protein S1 [Peptostreptococcus canis]|uniref:S1 RNA-binding domain-containing protein n=1 Tax=Peptostreptococcus canis TaxID=1159213 RepID=A0ABR6TKS2_9FIRM|nr:S1 RNA-binding domain-containing protein [Peptostreptococcus canis]MBC2575999.1 S1 RNA-binding domain-containing protein [Peptostreptococcus canis]MBP1997877.1 small subunit ribosomal protein S1 [Peptostreptococcus canis]
MENNLTMQELLDMQEEELSKINVGEEITGKVTEIHNDELILKLEVGFDGVIPAGELNLEKGQAISDVYKIDDEVTGIITNISYKDATIKISKLKLEQQADLKELIEAMENRTIINVHAFKAFERGLYVKYKSYTMFMPISQIDTKFVKDTSEYVGQDLDCYVKEVNPRKNRIIVSHREVAQEILDAERKERREQIKAEREAERARIRAEREQQKAEREALFQSLVPGEKRLGKVTNIMPYGAFIDLGGIEGLAHINNLSWTRVESVESVLNVGDEVNVFIQSIDPETKRIALAVKDPDQDPWKLIADELEIGSVVDAKVLRIIDKGAFVEVKPGVEAYLPIGELSEGRVNKVEDVVNIGDTIKAAIIKFNPDNKRMMLSIRELTREPEEDLTQYMSLGDDTIGNVGDVLKEKTESSSEEE